MTSEPPRWTWLWHRYTRLLRAEAGGWRTPVAIGAAAITALFTYLVPFLCTLAAVLLVAGYTQSQQLAAATLVIMGHLLFPLCLLGGYYLLTGLSNTLSTYETANDLFYGTVIGVYSFFGMMIPFTIYYLSSGDPLLSIHVLRLVPAIAVSALIGAGAFYIGSSASAPRHRARG